MTNSIEIYQSDDGQMHLKNVFADTELDEKATTKDFLVVRQEGKGQAQRNLKHHLILDTEATRCRI